MLIVEVLVNCGGRNLEFEEMVKFIQVSPLLKYTSKNNPKKRKGLCKTWANERDRPRTGASCPRPEFLQCHKLKPSLSLSSPSSLGLDNGHYHSWSQSPGFQVKEDPLGSSLKITKLSVGVDISLFPRLLPIKSRHQVIAYGNFIYRLVFTQISRNE